MVIVFSVSQSSDLKSRSLKSKVSESSASKSKVSKSRVSKSNVSKSIVSESNVSKPHSLIYKKEYHHMNNPKHHHSISCASGAAFFYLIGDYIALVLAGILSLAIRNLLITHTTYHIAPIYQYFWVPLVYMAFILYEGLYGKRMLIYQMMKKLFRASLGGTVFSIILMFLAQVAGDVSRFYVILYTAISFALLCLFRVILAKGMKKSKAFQIPILIVGVGKTGEAMARQIQNDTGMRYRIVGFLEDHEPYDKSCTILGGFGDMERVIRDTGVQHVIIAAPRIPQTQLSSLIYQAQTLVRSVGVVPNLVAVPMSNMTVESFFDAKIMVLQIWNNLARTSNQIAKRLFYLAATICSGLNIRFIRDKEMLILSRVSRQR